MLLSDQLVHVLRDLFVRHLRIDLRAGYGRVPHHLGDALYRDACAERQRPERMTSHVEDRRCLMPQALPTVLSLLFIVLRLPAVRKD